MEPDRAKQILRALADGRDPATGEQFPPDSPYQQADTVRALFAALEALEKGSRRRDPRLVDPNKPKVGANWTPEEEQQLRDAFAAHKPIHEVAAAHGRTPGAITARLARLGLIDDSAASRAGQGNRPSDFPPRPSRLPSVASAEECPTPHGGVSERSRVPSDSSAPRPPSPPRALTEEEKDSLPF